MRATRRSRRCATRIWRSSNGARAGIDEALVDDAQGVDRDFHEALIDHLGNDIISKSYRVNWIKVRLIRQNETALYDDLVEPVMREHLSVIEVIARRDQDGAVAALTRHINNARSRAMRIGRERRRKGGGQHEHHTTANSPPGRRRSRLRAVDHASGRARRP